MKKRFVHKLVCPVQLIPGDTFNILIHDKCQIYKYSEKIGRTMTIDTIITFDANGSELGVKGIGVVFGKAI